MSVPTFFPIGSTGFESSDPTGLGVSQVNFWDTVKKSPLNPLNMMDPFNLSGANANAPLASAEGGIKTLFQAATWERAVLIVLGLIFITVALVMFGKGTIEKVI